MSPEEKPARATFIPFTPRMHQVKAEMDLTWTAMVNGFLAAHPEADGKWVVASDGSGLVRSEP